MEQTVQLIIAAQHELFLDQQQLADLIGVSKRTVQRHTAFGGLPTLEDGHKLIVALHPKNPALAARLATALGTTLPALGIRSPAAPPPPPPPAKEGDADSVVCAAADALEIVPRDARPVVAAIFARALALEVDLMSLAKLLAAPRPAPDKPAVKR